MIHVPYLVKAMAGGICQIMSALPLDRACYAEAPPDVRELVASAANRDPWMKAKLITLGELTKFPPDARKPAQWVHTTAEWLDYITGGRTLIMQPQHLWQWSVPCLSSGFRKSFAPGAKPQKHRELDELIAEMVGHTLNSSPLTELIVSFSGINTAAEVVTKSLFSRKWQAQSLDAVRTALTRYQHDLQVCEVPNADLHYRRFLWFMTGLPQSLLALSADRHGEAIVARAVTQGWLQPRKVLFSQIDRQLLADLSAIPEMRCLGHQVVELGSRDVHLDEWVRHTLQRCPFARQFESEILSVVRRLPANVPWLAEAVEVFDSLLRPAAGNDQRAIREAFEQFSRHTWKSHSKTGVCRLAASLRDVVDPHYRHRFVMFARQVRQSG